jgi:hypothetical protein
MGLISEEIKATTYMLTSTETGISQNNAMDKIFK